MTPLRGLDCSKASLDAPPEIERRVVYLGNEAE